MQRPRLTKLQVVPGELPLLIVGQLGGVDEGVAVAFIALDDLPAHLVLGLLLGGGEGKADRGIGGVRPVAPPTWLVSNFLVRPASS